MALPTLVKTWQHNVNNLQAAQGTAALDGKFAFLNVKNALLGFGSTPCTVDYSCNSVTAGTKGDHVDRLTTLANIIGGNAGSAHSWIVLNFPGMCGGTAQLMFSFLASNFAANIQFSPSVGFTGGSTTADPTASDSIALNTNYISMPVDQAVRWSVSLSTDGQECHIFFAGGGSVLGAWYFKTPTNVITPWTNPWVALVQNTNPVIGPGAGGITALTSAARTRLNSASCIIAMSCEGISLNLLPSETNIGQVANELTGEWYMLPIGACGATTGARGRHGTYVDMWLGSNAIATGDSYPASGTTGQFAQFGSIIVPWNNGAVNLS